MGGHIEHRPARALQRLKVELAGREILEAQSGTPYASALDEGAGLSYRAANMSSASCGAFGGDNRPHDDLR